MKVLDRVCFNAAVIRRSQHSPVVVAFAGNVDRFEANGKLAVVNVDGGGTKTVPVANLARVTKSHGIVDPTN